MILEAELGEIYVSYIKPTVDKEMSDTSSNAVENRVIKKYVDGRISEVEGFVTPNSDEPVGGVLKKIKIGDINYSIEGGGEEGKCVIQKRTLGELPSIGKINEVYFVISENATYRWDDDNLKYECVGRNYKEIEIINGGNA